MRFKKNAKLANILPTREIDKKIKPYKINMYHTRMIKAVALASDDVTHFHELHFTKIGLTC